MAKVFHRQAWTVEFDTEELQAIRAGLGAVVSSYPEATPIPRDDKLTAQLDTMRRIVNDLGVVGA